MEIAYELTAKDFSEAFTAHRNRNLFGKWIRRLFLLCVILVVAMILLAFVIKPSAEAAKSLMPLFALSIVWAAIVWGHPRWNARRQFLKQPGVHGPRKVSLDATGVHWRWNGGSSDIDWKNYVRSLEGKNQFLLYTSPACFNIIPKRALEPGRLNEVRALLNQNIPIT